ncbi:hypothetical protein [Paracoccus sulfuroxidans]|uniref:hypothetical protein n=1 Tax=Paracoccus sulfuroxidans TaxID=384678 RepID=UPI0011AA49B2|nr:hypothetical protein [Paracoccus sulfuroxidans]
MALKWRIAYLDQSIPKRVGHNLAVLAEVLQNELERIYPKEDIMNDAVISNIREISSVDPRAISFRYADDHNGCSLHISPESWSVSRLYFSSDSLALWFDSLSDIIDRVRDGTY